MNLNNSLRKTPVAVIGMSSLFADAKNIEEFWNNIVQARDSITDVPENRWRIEDYYDPDPTVPDKTYCKRGGFLPNIDFNPMEFGLPPNILEVTDASQLLALIAARDAFAHAGYGKKSEKFTAEVKAKTGVLLGVGGGQKLITPLTGRLQYPIWEKALRSCGIAETDIPHIVDKMKKAYIGWNENSFPGMLGNVISGRITNRFDLGGINSVVDAACAASLSAVKMALSELVEGRADMMLTGGVDTDNSPFMYMSFSKTPAFSKSNVISPFSDKADGMLIGEGLGMVVLKRLEDAERDGDTIYAVIKGVGTSSDGRFKSVYAPRPSGQASAMNRAYEEAGFEAKTVGLIEAHGTGTNAGDACELTSMGMVFSANNDQKSHIALGTVKSQVGHTKAAAGAAGLLKAVLALHHKVLPPTINVDQPTEKVDLKDSPLYINTEARPWFNNNEPRRASVSAFGFGGINVHIALEEYQAQPVEKDYRIHEPYKAVVLQANTVADLAQLCQNKLEQLNTADQEIAFWELVNHQTQNIPANAARLGFMTTDIASAKEVLTLAIQKLSTSNNAWEHPKGIYFRPNGMDAQGKVVALFSGQGSQYVGMGRQLVNAFPQLRTVIDQQDRLFTQANRPALSETMYPIPVFNKEDAATQLQALTQTQNAQPAIGALSMGMYKTIQDAGFKADFVAGHSFGELTALWAAGVYDDATFLALAKARGEAMAAQSPNADAGTMLAVKADYNKVNAAIQNLQGVKIANVNSNNQVILGGSKPAIATAQETLKNQGFAVIPLPVSAAFHTEFVGHAQKPFADFVARQNLQAPKVPVYSNTTSNPYPTAPASIKEILQGQILKPVLFKNQIENIHQAGGRIFIEFGPKGVLSNLVKDILKGKDFIALAMNGNAKKDSDLQFRQAVLQLRVLGLALHELDPFKAPSTKPAPKTKMTINMGGHNYVSKPTQKAYYDALNDGYQVKGGGQVVEKVVEVIKEVPVEKIVEKIIEVPVEKVVHSNNINIEEDEEMNKELIETLKATVEMVTTQQNKSLELFQNFLSEQNKQSQLLLQMMTQQLNLANQPALQATVQASLQEAKVETIAAPSFQPAVASNEPIITPAPTATPVTPAAPTANTGGLSTQKLEEILLTVISEKTGYPTEMLELDMDMEADLGIDSIKRVEIFGAMTEDYPEVSGVNPQELTELRTLGQIVDYLAGKAGASATATTATTTPAPTATPVTPAAPTANAGGLSTQKLEEILLTVISEKTGYPTEMLELDMDMEADLGIDSIKRVEIFGAMTEDYPEVSGVNPQELTELRTLGQIVDYLAGKAGASATATTATTTPAPTATPVTPAAPTANTGGLSTQKLEEILLTVISEKTGYPTEMLELDMDMEADLGIDSIKRVEIFGAMTEDYPEVSGVNPQELTELRTLGQIVDYLAGKAGASATATTATTTPAPTATPVTPAAPTANTGGLSTQKLEEILLTVISEKTGYPTEMLELDMDMEADLGIDSIKRVEIFGAMTEDYPEVSGVNPQELTELRTLGQIVDYLAEKAGSKKKSPSVIDTTKATVGEDVTVKAYPKNFTTTSSFHGVERNEIGLKYLPKPDYLEFTIPDTHVALITNDGSELSLQVLQALEQKGNKVVVLNLHQVKNPITSNAVSLSSNTDQAIKTAIETIQNQYGQIGTFIHLHPHFEFQNGNFAQHFAIERDLIKAVFLIAKHIQPSLNELGKTNRVNFMTVTRLDGKSGLGKRGNTSIVGGGLNGLVKCLNLEWSQVYCRAVDIQPELTTTTIANHILTELHDPNRSVIETAISEDGRAMLAAKKVNVYENKQIETAVNENAVFLVSGGARGVTANCVIEMAKAFQSKFILLGRSNYAFEIPEYAKNESDDGALKRLIMTDMKNKGQKPNLAEVKKIFNSIVAKKEIDQTIQAIKQNGGQAVYIKGDVTDVTTVKPQLLAITKRWGNITGIIHGAGRLADKYIQDKAEQDFLNVLTVKLDGLLTLLQCVNIHKLEHLVLFSSVAGFYGNVGQTDYAIANEILSKAAHLFRTNHPNTQVSAINWGAWDAGMVSDALKKKFEEMGVVLVNSEGGPAMMVNEMNIAYADQPQVIIGGTLPAGISYTEGALETHRIHRSMTLKDNPFLMHHVIQGNAVLPVVNAVGWMANTCEQVFPDFAVHIVKDAKLFKGLVFDGTAPTNYIVELKEIQKDSDTIIIETTVLSQAPTAKLPTYHYKANITLVAKKNKLDIPTFQHQVSNTYTPTNGETLYQDGSLFHGEYFRGIEQVLDWTENQIVLKCKAPEVPQKDQGQFPVLGVNTFFSDIQYQGMVIWVQRYNNGAKSLPLSTESATVYKPVPFGKELFVHIEIVESNEFKMVANCTTYDENGEVYLFTKNAAVTVSKELEW